MAQGREREREVLKDTVIALIKFSFSQLLFQTD